MPLCESVCVCNPYLMYWAERRRARTSPKPQCSTNPQWWKSLRRACFSWILSIEDNYILHSTFITPLLLLLPPHHMLFCFLLLLSVVFCQKRKSTRMFLCWRDCLTQQEQRVAVLSTLCHKLLCRLFLPPLFIIVPLSYICLRQPSWEVFVTKKPACSLSVCTLWLGQRTQHQKELKRK